MSIELLSADQMGHHPADFYLVAEGPGKLAGMSYPSDQKWDSLFGSGYRHVVCLTDDTPRYDPSPLGVLYAGQMKDLVGGREPLDPEHEERCVRDAVVLIRQRVLAGEGVVVHCQGGTGRTGTVIACALRALGVPLPAIFAHMKTVNGARTKYPGWRGWPESNWQMRLLERY